MQFKQFYNESIGRKMLVVDVQPEYERSFGFEISQFCSMLNIASQTTEIHVLFNGPDLGFQSAEELHYWYIENGLDEDVQLTFFDKGYAFFRYCMDSNIDEEDIITLVKFMVTHGINDSRELKESDLWDMFVQKYKLPELRALLEFSGDCINIPDLMAYLRKLGNNFVVIGGGVDECLKEVEISLRANNQTYQLDHKWIY